jgi:hypothetical protein
MGERRCGPRHDAKPAASLVVWSSGGDTECRAPEIRVKAMEAVQSLERSREGLPGVWGAERIEDGGGNWGSPPRPGSLRTLLPERGVL